MLLFIQSSNIIVRKIMKKLLFVLAVSFFCVSYAYAEINNLSLVPEGIYEGKIIFEEPTDDMKKTKKDTQDLKILVSNNIISGISPGNDFPVPFVFSGVNLIDTIGHRYSFHRNIIKIKESKINPFKIRGKAKFVPNKNNEISLFKGIYLNNENGSFLNIGSDGTAFFLLKGLTDTDLPDLPLLGKINNLGEFTVEVKSDLINIEIEKTSEVSFNIIVSLNDGPETFSVDKIDSNID